MGNLSFIVPTKNIEDFNMEKIYQLLLEKFTELDITKDEKFEQIQIYDKEIFIMDLYFNQDCYILKYNEDIKYLKEEMNMPELADWLVKLKKLKPDLNNVIQSTYGQDYNIKNDVDFFIKDYFTSYLFDEGIHPEFMAPDYIRKTPVKKIKSFWNFWS